MEKTKSGLLLARTESRNMRTLRRIFSENRICLAFLLMGALLLGGCGQTTGAMIDSRSYELGMSSLEAGSYESAITYFQEAIENDGKNAEAYRGIGICRLKQGQYDQALVYFNEAIEAVTYPAENDEFLTDVKRYQADAYLGSGQTDNALTVYTSLLESDRADIAYLQRGKIYASQDKFGQAAQDFSKALDRNQSYGMYLQIYEVYALRNLQADGAAYLAQALEHSPVTADDYFQVGRINYELKDYPAAREALTKAMNSKVSGSVAILGKVYILSDDITGARAVYRKAIETDFDAAAGYNGLAICDMMEGDLESALKNIHSGLSISESAMREALLFNEIVIYEKKEDFETAAAKMENFLKYFPTNQAAIRENYFLSSRVLEANEAANFVHIQEAMEEITHTAQTEADLARNEEEEQEQEETVSDNEPRYLDDGTYYDGYGGYWTTSGLYLTEEQYWNYVWYGDPYYGTYDYGY